MGAPNVDPSSLDHHVDRAHATTHRGLEIMGVVVSREYVLELEARIAALEARLVRLEGRK